MKNDAELLKKTKNNKSENLKYRTEKRDHENNSKSLKIDNEYFKKKYKSLNFKSLNGFLGITEFWLDQDQL